MRERRDWRRHPKSACSKESSKAVSCSPKQWETHFTVTVSHLLRRCVQLCHFATALLFHSRGSGDDHSNPAHSTIVLLFSIYLGCVALGILLIVVGLPHQPVLAQTVDLVPGNSIASTLKLVLQPKMWLLLPYLLSSGLMYGFITDEFTKNIVKPSLGEDNLGFVSSCTNSTQIESLF